MPGIKLCGISRDRERPLPAGLLKGISLSQPGWGLEGSLWGERNSVDAQVGSRKTGSVISDLSVKARRQSPLPLHALPGNILPTSL